MILTPTPTSSLQNRFSFPFIDGLRGLLAVWVFVYHSNALVNGGLPIPPGAIAVELFMFVSGFLMTLHYRERRASEPWQATKTWGRFYVRRYFRIAPLYYSFLLISFGLSAIFASLTRELQIVFPPSWVKSVTPDPTLVDITFSNVLLHLSFLFGFLSAYASNNTIPDWSLSLEMQFYFAFPFIMLLLVRIRPLGVAALCTVLFIVAGQLFSVDITAKPKCRDHFERWLLLRLPACRSTPLHGAAMSWLKSLSLQWVSGY